MRMPRETMSETMSTTEGVAVAARGDTVSALDRGLAVLNCFRDGQRLLSATELSRITGIPRPTVIRLSASLVANRWLQVEPGGERYMLGAGVVSLARAFLSSLDVRAASRGPMQALAEQTGGAVYLAVRDGLEMVLIEACRARSSMLAARLDVGSRVPLPNSALGRACLGAEAADTRAELIESLRLAYLARSRSDNQNDAGNGVGNAIESGGAEHSDWPALEAGLQRALQEHARTGLSISAGEFHREINSVSVALLGPDGEVMSFNCGGPAFRFDAEHLRADVAPLLVAMVRQIAADIGGRAVLGTGEQDATH